MMQISPHSSFNKGCTILRRVHLVWRRRWASHVEPSTQPSYSENDLRKEKHKPHVDIPVFRFEQAHSTTGHYDPEPHQPAATPSHGSKGMGSLGGR